MALAKIKLYYVLNLISKNQLGFNLLNANPTKWSDTLKQFVGKLPTNCLSVFDHFVKLALKELKVKIPALINLFLLLTMFSIPWM